MIAGENYFFEQEFFENFKIFTKSNFVNEILQRKLKKTGVFRRSHVKNDPINSIDPSGLKVYDPDNVIPSWIKDTPIYKELDNAFAIISVRDLTGSMDIDEGKTTSSMFGRWQTVDIDKNASTSNFCGLTGVEQTVLHEFVHAQQNLSRYSGGPSLEAQDAKLMEKVFLQSLGYKK